MKSLKIFWQLLKMGFSEFFSDNGLKLSASLSYYTVFSIAPLLVIIISLAGIFFGVEAVQGRIYGQINGLVGNAAAIQIQEIIKNVKTSQNSQGGAIIGFIVLMIGASGVFTEIQDSINFIWSVKAKPKKGWLKLIINRLLSFSLIASFGFLLLVSLMVNAVMDLLSDRLIKLFPNATVYLFYILNIALIFIIISCLFAIIFKVLPDARIKWKDAFIGSFFTAFLFIGGKYLIGLYLGNSSIGETYGAAASIVLVLLWVYYSSIILYFGAEFTKMYALHYGGKITPNETAVFIVKQEVKEIDVNPSKEAVAK
ncbi:MAG: YihY/virulence factor BrkB family protein [Cyclobacteriaceae bacterium]|nr:YihY/virulence factor BrkB family protein [Cyclobacteriaceae bacterium]